MNFADIDTERLRLITAEVDRFIDFDAEVFGQTLAGDVAIRNYLEPIKRHLAEAGATEVWINRPGELLIEVGSTTKVVHDPLLSYQALEGLAQAIAVYTQQHIGPTHPLLSATLPDGERVQIVLPPAVEPGSIAMAIRIPGSAIVPLRDYQAAGALSRFCWGCPRDLRTRADELAAEDRALVDALRDDRLHDFLVMAVRARKNIAVVGDTGSGKTTLMKSMCQHIPADERLITIEDVRELQLPAHPNRSHLLYSKGGQSLAQVSAADLLAACMRLNPTRVLQAELRSREAWDFLKLLTSGHSGSLTSWHAESCALASERFMFMAKENPEAASLSRDELKHLVRLTIDVVIHVTREVVNADDGSADRVLRFIDEVSFDPWAKLEARFAAGDVHRCGA